MSSKRDIRDYLNDIIESIDDIELFINDLDFDGFCADRKTANAVIRSLEIIGEAVKKIPSDIKEYYQSVPWIEIGGMRNKLIHEYFGVDLEIVWHTIKNDIPQLKPEIQNIINEIAK